jgi:hypothetical protein
MDVKNLGILLQHILSWFERERWIKDDGLKMTIHTFYWNSIFTWPYTKVSDIQEITTLFGAFYTFK